MVAIQRIPTDPFQQASMLSDPFKYAASFAGMSVGTGARSMGYWGGDKFPGGFGITKLDKLDYWELRARSAQLFRENLYARGLLRRLITNEINVGLSLEAEPNDELISALTEEQAEAWSTTVEDRFEAWAAEPRMCDWEEQRNFGQLQQHVRIESLIEGDVLVVLRYDRRTNLPKLQVIRGGLVTTPLGKQKGNPGQVGKISHGIELDGRNRQIAYWVSQGDGTHKRVNAYGPRSGRRTAWLIYGTERRSGQVRGTPLLTLMLQSLNELDRYRDSEQRAATVNSILAMFIKKEVALPGSTPISGGAVRNVVAQTTGPSGETREFKSAEMWPGMVIEELQAGETPVSFDTKRPNANYPEFEAAIIHAIAWANEIPPEILTLAFSNNYSASKAAITEFNAYIIKFRADWGACFCQPVYVEWLISETLAGRIDAAGFLQAWRDPLRYAEFGAWTRSEWGGPVKPSVELAKDIKAWLTAIDGNLTSMDRASKTLFGQRFARVQKRRLKERRILAQNDEALGLNAEPDPAAPQPPQPEPAPTMPAAMLAQFADMIADVISDELQNVRVQ